MTENWGSVPQPGSQRLFMIKPHRWDRIWMSNLYYPMTPRPPLLRTGSQTPLGNIRPTYIKRIAIELVKNHGAEFTDDFEHNKQKVSELTDVRYRKMRNRIAGYVTRYRQHYEA